MPEEEEFEYTKGVIRIRKSKNSQCNAQTKPQKNDLQITTQNTKLRSSNTNPTKNQGELMCSGRASSSCSTFKFYTEFL